MLIRVLNSNQEVSVEIRRWIQKIEVYLSFGQNLRPSVYRLMSILKLSMVLPPQMQSISCSLGQMTTLQS